MSYIFFGLNKMKDMGKRIVEAVNISVGIVFIIIGPRGKAWDWLWVTFEIMAIGISLIPPKTKNKIAK